MLNKKWAFCWVVVSFSDFCVIFYRLNVRIPIGLFIHCFPPASPPSVSYDAVKKKHLGPENIIPWSFFRKEVSRQQWVPQVCISELNEVDDLFFVHTDWVFETKKKQKTQLQIEYKLLFQKDFLSNLTTLRTKLIF